MNIVNYLQFLEPMQEQVLKIYSMASGIITVILVIWVINFLVGLIRKTYSTGIVIGTFYRNYIHRYLKSLLLKIVSLFKSNANNNTVKNKDKTLSAIR